MNGKIKNIVFDLGRVLIDFNPEEYMQSLGLSEKQISDLISIFFADGDWNKYDRGDYHRVKYLLDALVKKHPDYEKELNLFLNNDWVKIHTLKEDTVSYLTQLKTEGYRIYVLSNLSNDSYDYVSKYDFFRLVDGAVFSCFERVCKPEEKIYRVLLERYSLIPDETIFFDDLPANIAKADEMGIHGILFTSFDEAKARADKLLNRE